MKIITLKEFNDIGLVQELNRLFLHPMGFELCVKVDEEKGTAELASICDCREDKLALLFPKEVLDTDEARLKEETVKGIFDSRTADPGWRVQPVPKKEE